MINYGFFLRIGGFYGLLKGKMEFCLRKKMESICSIFLFRWFLLWIRRRQTEKYFFFPNFWTKTGFWWISDDFLRFLIKKKIFSGKICPTGMFYTKFGVRPSCPRDFVHRTCGQPKSMFFFWIFLKMPETHKKTIISSKLKKKIG